MTKKNKSEGQQAAETVTSDDTLDKTLIEQLNEAHQDIEPLPAVKQRMHTELLANIKAQPRRSKAAKKTGSPTAETAKSDLLAQTLTVRANEGEWISVKSNIEVKPLYLDRIAGTRSFLMRLQAGAQWPAHEHSIDEECIVLQGDIRIGDLSIGAGDYHLAPKGVRHERFVSENGALLFLRAGIKDTELSLGAKAAYVWQRLNSGLKNLLP